MGSCHLAISNTCSDAGHRFTFSLIVIQTQLEWGAKSQQNILTSHLLKGKLPQFWGGSRLLTPGYGHLRLKAPLCSVQFSHSDVSNSLWPPWTAVRQASLSITNSWSLLRLMFIESVMPSNHLILCRPLPFFSHLKSFPALGSFQMSQFFTSSGQSIGVSASTSVLPMNTQN